jgi:hypothetical protein
MIDPVESGDTARSGTRRTLLRGVALLAAWPVLGLASPARASERVPNGPDFANVTTKAAARQLVREGKLVRIHFFPLELGGPDEPHNVGFVTPEAAEVREMLVGTLVRFFEDGLIDKLRVLPEYAGESIVPIRIVMEAGREGDEEGGFSGSIEVW